MEGVVEFWFKYFCLISMDSVTHAPNTPQSVAMYPFLLDVPVSLVSVTNFLNKRSFPVMNQN